MSNGRAPLFDSVASTSQVPSPDAPVRSQSGGDVSTSSSGPLANGGLPRLTRLGSFHATSTVRRGETTVRRRDSLPAIPSPVAELGWMDEIEDPTAEGTKSGGLDWLGRKRRYRDKSDIKVVQLRPQRRSSLMVALRKSLGSKDNMVEVEPLALSPDEGEWGGSSTNSTPARCLTPSREQAEAARARATADIERDKLYIASKVRFVINPHAPFMSWCVRATCPPFVPARLTTLLPQATCLAWHVHRSISLCSPEACTPREASRPTCRLKSRGSHGGWDGSRRRRPTTPLNRVS